MCLNSCLHHTSKGEGILMSHIRASKTLIPGFNGLIATVGFLCIMLFTPAQVFAATSVNSQHSHAAAWSCGNPNTGHCYGTTFWGGANGADTRITLNPSLNGGGTNNDRINDSFVTNEMWLESSGATYWVEAGVISEYSYAGTTYPFYFWADNRPSGGGFSFHYITSEASSGNALVRITRSGTSNWNVLVRDSTSYTGTSTVNNISIANIMLGAELHNNYQTAYDPGTDYTNNRWLGSNGNFNYQPNDGTGTKINSPVTAYWNTYPTSSSTGGDWYTYIP
jgi:hypothetical protein